MGFGERDEKAPFGNKRGWGGMGFRAELASVTAGIAMVWIMQDMGLRLEVYTVVQDCALAEK